jgi:3-dehydroquinate synthase
LPDIEVGRIAELLGRAGLPTELDLPAAQKPKLLRVMALDKKVRDGEVKFVLARKIGKVEIGRRVPNDVLHQLLSKSKTVS